MSFSCVFFGAFWLDPGEGCESMRAAAPACSLARALRALAGGLSWERLGRIALLGTALEILPKSLPQASRENHQEKRLDSDGKHEERSTKNGEKNQSKAPGGTTKPTWREHREHQDCECGGSRAALARALRALAGRLELERFVSFSCVFSGAFWLDPREG